MSSVIKDVGHDAPHCERFQLPEIDPNADDILSAARRKAKEIVARAEAEASHVRAEAIEQARQTQDEAFRTAVDASTDEQLQSLRIAVATAIDELQQCRETWLARWEQQALQLALAIAERIIRRELEETSDITLDLVREALDLFSNSSRLRLALNPEDLQVLGSKIEQLASGTSAGTIEFVSDETLARGGCRLESTHGMIDQTIEAQLSRIEQELSATA